MAILTPVIVPFDTVDANEHFYIEYVGDLSSTTNNRFNWWRFIITNLDTNTKIISTGSNIEVTNTVDFEEYFDNQFVYNAKTTSVGIWSSINRSYYFGFPKNYIYDGQTIFENGSRYSIEIDFGVNAPNEVVTSPYPFACYANFTISLDSCQYNDGTKTEITTQDITMPYNITVSKSYCKLNFSYTQNDGEQLRYYQFSLYNNDVLLGVSKKIYGIPNEGIVYGIENYNNLQHYTLKLYCVTQTNRSSTTTINIHTNYEQDNIYADISFIVDKQSAENNVSISVVQLNGEGANYTYDNQSEYVVIPDNGYVTFLDKYQVINNSFLIRMWCKNLKINQPILAINTSDHSGRVEVYFDGLNFIAKKYSCGLTSPYITCIKDTNEADITSVLPTDTKIYFAMGYYNGRIEMYARVIS